MPCVGAKQRVRSHAPVR